MMVDWSGHTVTRPTLDDDDVNVNEEEQEFNGDTPELLDYLDRLDHEITQLIHTRHRLSAYLGKRMNSQFDMLSKLNTVFAENLNAPEKSVPF